MTRNFIRRLLRLVFRNDCSGRQIENADDGGLVAFGQSSFRELGDDLPTYDGKRLFGKLPVVDRNCLNEVQENAGEGIRRGRGVIKSPELFWRHWTGSSWAREVTPPGFGVNWTAKNMGGS